MFGKKELMSTFSHAEQMAVCELLRANGIAYAVDTAGTATRNIGGRWPASNRFGQQDNAEYRILVAKKQHESAEVLLRGFRQNR